MGSCFPVDKYTGPKDHGQGSHHEEGVGRKKERRGYAHKKREEETKMPVLYRGKSPWGRAAQLLGWEVQSWGMPGRN